MKLSAGLLLAASSLAAAQVTYDDSTETWHCPVANGAYCLDGSLNSSRIILCTNGVGREGNCDGHAQYRPPVDIYYAPCWEMSASAGNATCSKNCTVFPDFGVPFSVPGSCTPSGPSYGSNITFYNATNTTVIAPCAPNSTTLLNGTTNSTAYGGNGTMGENSTANATSTSSSSATSTAHLSSTSSHAASSATTSPAVSTGAANPNMVATGSTVLGLGVFVLAALGL